MGISKGESNLLTNAPTSLALPEYRQSSIEKNQSDDRACMLLFPLGQPES